MVEGVAPSFTQMMISQVPASFALGVQLSVLLDCQLGAVTSGIQAEVPARRRKSAYCVVAGWPPRAVAVQLMGVPAGADDGLPVPETLRGAVTSRVPAL